MGSGFKDFAAGDILTANDVDGYLMRQTVMTFADATARDTALSGVLDEGMMAYLEDTNLLTYYTGSAWVDIITASTAGTWTAFTPSWYNVTVGNGTQKAYYTTVNGIVHVAGELVFGSTTAFTGNVGFASPVTVNGTVLGSFTGVGQVIVNGNQYGLAQRVGNDLFLYSINTGAATGAANLPNMNATSPKTFTTGDDIRWYLTYATT